MVDETDLSKALAAMDAMYDKYKKAELARVRAVQTLENLKKLLPSPTENKLKKEELKKIIEGAIIEIDKYFTSVGEGD